MTGWGVLFQFGVAATGALVFLSLVADDLRRAQTEQDERNAEHERLLREERFEREAAAGAMTVGQPASNGPGPLDVVDARPWTAEPESPAHDMPEQP